jgi:hypothetical protein
MKKATAISHGNTCLLAARVARGANAVMGVWLL